MNEGVELFHINGKYYLISNLYGAEPENLVCPIQCTIEAEIVDNYTLYRDDFCYDVLFVKKADNFRYGLIYKQSIQGQGVCNYCSANDKLFIYDDYQILKGWNNHIHQSSNGSPDLLKLKGYIAVKREGKWGIIMVFKTNLIPILHKEVVPCKYPDLLDAIAKLLNNPPEHPYIASLRQKLNGWYTNPEYAEKALTRIIKMREQIVAKLLKSNCCVLSLLTYLDTSGFYYRPSSDKGHHNFPGGLAEHSWGVYQLMEQWNQSSVEDRKANIISHKLQHYGASLDEHFYHHNLEEQDIILAALCHDLCKAQRFDMRARTIKHEHEADDEYRMHSALSVKRLTSHVQNINHELDEVVLAIRNHMRLYEEYTKPTDRKIRRQGRKSVLSNILYTADKIDASRHPARY